MANSSENLNGIEFSELAAFELGVTLGKVDRLLCWLTKTRQYSPGLATWLFESGTIPDDQLNPYQGIPLSFVRGERSRFLVEIQKACCQFSTLEKGVATARELTGSDDVPQMAKLFDRLDKLEEERFYENLKWLPSEQQENAKTDFEERRSGLQESIMSLASKIQSKISDEQSTVPPSCLSMLLFGVHLESLKYAFSDRSKSVTRFSSRWLAAWVTFAQKYVSRAAASCHRLQELTPVMWVDSGLSFDQQISNLIEQVRRVLKKEAASARDALGPDSQAFGETVSPAEEMQDVEPSKDNALEAKKSLENSDEDICTEFSWKRTEAGLCLCGVFVELDSDLQEKVLARLCEADRVLSAEDLAKRGTDGDESEKGGIRRLLCGIRKQLRSAFMTEKDPIPTRRPNKQGQWYLDRELLVKSANDLRKSKCPSVKWQ